MEQQLLRAGLWLHTLLVGVCGLALYLAPASAVLLWPWMLPPLAARFVGSLLLASALDTGIAAAAPSAPTIAGSLLMGVSLYGLIALTGVLALGDLGISTMLVLWLAVFGALAVLSAGCLLSLIGLDTELASAQPQTPLLRGLLLVDCVLVAPVGLLMYIAPAIARRFWPWDMPPINIRLIGSIFVATMILSLWALRQRGWEQVRPSVAAGGAFATLALIASVLHFSLFDPSRLVTWIFLFLYAIVSLGGILVLVQYRLRRATT